MLEAGLMAHDGRKKTAEKLNRELFEKALPDLRATLEEGISAEARKSWAEHVVYTTVGLAKDLRKHLSSKQVERMMLREVYNASWSRKKGFTDAFKECIMRWEAKRKAGERLGHRPKPKEKALFLKKPGEHPKTHHARA